MDFVAIVVDDGGHTHIAASDHSGIRYFTDETGDWLRTDLTKAPAGGADIDPAIAVDSSGTVAIAFTRWSTWEYCVDLCEDPVTPILDGVYYMTSSGGTWSNMLPVPNAGERPTIAFAGRDFHVVTEVDPADPSFPEELSWSRLPDGSTAEWSTSFISAEGPVTDPQLVVDRNSVACVLLRGPLGIQLHRRSPLDEFDGFPLEVHEAERPLLAFDQLNRPHVVYGRYDLANDSSFSMHAVMGDDGTWAAPAPVGLPSASSFAIDDGGVMHFTFKSVVEEQEDDEPWAWEEIWYATVDGETVASVRLDRSDMYEFGSAGVTTMALDSAGRPHVVFSANGLDFEGRGLFYALGPAAEE
jgi:hypothetical protein